MTGDERIEAVEGLADEFMAAHEEGDVDAINSLWASADREALVTVLAGWLLRAEAKLQSAERVLHMTRDVRPVGMSKMRAWEIASESEERNVA